MPWNLLGILLAVCAVACAVGFYKFVYFLSIGYGFAVAAGGVTTLIMYLVNPNAVPLWIMLAECALFIAYGARLSGFLLVRELKSATFRKTDVAKDTLNKNSEKKMPLFVLALHQRLHRRNRAGDRLCGIHLRPGIGIPC